MVWIRYWQVHEGFENCSQFGGSSQCYLPCFDQKIAGPKRVYKKLFGNQGFFLSLEAWGFSRHSWQHCWSAFYIWLAPGNRIMIPQHSWTPPLLAWGRWHHMETKVQMEFHQPDPFPCIIRVIRGEQYIWGCNCCSRHIQLTVWDIHENSMCRDIWRLISNPRKLYRASCICLCVRVCIHFSFAFK